MSSSHFNETLAQAVGIGADTSHSTVASTDVASTTHIKHYFNTTSNSSATILTTAGHRTDADGLFTMIAEESTADKFTSFSTLLTQEVTVETTIQSREDAESTPHPTTIFSTEADDLSTTSSIVSSSSSVGVGVGVGIGLAVLLVLIIAIIVLIVRKRKRREREKNILKMENPKYRTEEEEALAASRHPPTFDLTAHTEPSVRFQGNNNAAVKYETNSNRKKEAPAPPPIYRPNNKADAASKRKAPSPPAAMLAVSDLYEKDSNQGSTEALTSPYTASNQNADDIVEGDNSHSKPLLEEDSFRSSRLSPKKPTHHTFGKTDSSVPEIETEHAKTALLKKKKVPTATLR